MHGKNCKCEVCEAMDAGFTKEEIIESMVKEQIMCLEKYGYYIDYVIPEHDNDIINCHTHGLKENKHHMDLQIVLPIKPTICSIIIREMVDLINKGQVFHDKQVIISQSDMPIKFLKVKEGDRNVLRLLLSDKNKMLPDDENCDSLIKVQLSDIS